ncbi:Gastrokine-3 [Sciurus carolinensis]|uniref:Gastrokine-3 n=1 Tax=Sciurus carolinensis TaxID=30640 RepID=A0AA41N5J9_SCICA|nr:Gastrokine-3 [Sciurus carolinensis]
MNISDSHPLDGSVGTQLIHINAFRGVVSIRDNNVFSEWDGILDYKNDSSHYPSTHGLTYTVSRSRVKNLAQYGILIKDLCRDVPTYFAQQRKEGMLTT